MFFGSPEHIKFLRYEVLHIPTDGMFTTSTYIIESQGTLDLFKIMSWAYFRKLMSLQVWDFT